MRLPKFLQGKNKKILKANRIKIGSNNVDRAASSIAAEDIALDRKRDSYPLRYRPDAQLLV